MRTTSAPAACSSLTWATVASMSCVCVAVMLCTAIGWPPPIVIEPMRTERVGLRGIIGHWIFIRRWTQMERRWEIVVKLFDPR